MAESAALPPGAVMPLRFFGRDLVLFRTEAGQAILTDAHCPHMGAHIGYGGVVEAEGIRCPFHAWRFDTSGRCAEVPYATAGTVPSVGLTTWPVHETSGLVLTHFSEQGRPPTWHMPDRPEWGQSGWLGYETCGWRIRMHVQELAENIPDTAHFRFVHSLPVQPQAEVETDGHIYRQRTVTRGDGFDFSFTQEAFGLGLVWLHVHADVEYHFLTATTPIDEEHVDLRLLFLVNEGVGATALSPASLAHIKATMDNTALDVPIWEHKVYRERPPLVAGDGPIGVLRKWARQFYESSAPDP